MIALQETKPRGRGKSSKTLALIDAMHDILREIEPATVRSVCYRLFVDGWIDSMAVKNTGKVSKHLVWARENGIIPWGWVVDEHRRPESIASWDDPATLIAAAARQYRKDYWANQPEWIEIWSEKGTVRGTLEPVLQEFGVTLRVMHGYGSATVLNEVARETQDRALTVLYIGDWDPSGLNMSEVDIPQRLERYQGLATIRRVALTQNDVDLLGLPSFEAATKAKDSRHKWFIRNYGSKCWELDAMPPPMLRDRLRNAILELMDLDEWEQSQRIERAEIASIKECMGQWQASISTQVAKYLGEAG